MCHIATPTKNDIRSFAFLGILIGVYGFMAVEDRHGVYGLGGYGVDNGVEILLPSGSGRHLGLLLLARLN